MFLVGHVGHLCHLFLERCGSHNVDVLQSFLLYETYRDISGIVDIVLDAFDTESVEFPGEGRPGPSGVVGGEKHSQTLFTEEGYGLLGTGYQVVAVIHGTVEIEYRGLQFGEWSYHTALNDVLIFIHQNIPSSGIRSMSSVSDMRSISFPNPPAENIM